MKISGHSTKLLNYTNIWLIVYISLKYQLITREHKRFLGFLKGFKSTKASTVPDVLAFPTVDSNLPVGGC